MRLFVKFFFFRNFTKIMLRKRTSKFVKKRVRIFRKKVPRKSVSLAVKKYVKSTIHRQIENKSYQVGWSQDLGGYASSATLFAYPMTPYTGGMNITQGVTQSTRIGNQIKLRKLRFNFVLSSRTYNVANNPSPQPCEIEMMFCSLKPANGELPTAVDIQNLYQLNASSIAPSGFIYDFTQKVNTDLFHIYKRMRFKLGYSAAGGTGVNANAQSFANNDFKLNVVRNLDLTKYAPKTITYNDNASSPTSRCLFVLINVLPTIGGTAFAAGVFPARIDSTVYCDYEDA